MGKMWERLRGCQTEDWSLGEIPTPDSQSDDTKDSLLSASLFVHPATDLRPLSLEDAGGPRMHDN